MAETSQHKSNLNTFLTAIGYPERVPDGAVSFSLRVDGMEILAERETDGRIVLSYVLSDDAALLPTLAEYATGRMMREEATLSFDSRGAFLWQAASASADAHDWLRLFETFANSCDWWRERVVERRGDGISTETPFSEMMIRP